MAELTPSMPIALHPPTMINPEQPKVCPSPNVIHAAPGVSLPTH